MKILLFIFIIFLFTLLYTIFCEDNEPFKNKDALEKIVSKQLNANNQLLQICTNSSKSGIYKDGFCSIGEYNKGIDTLCVEMTDEFLKYTKENGIDLITPNPDEQFEGLKKGDKWCLSTILWINAYNKDKKLAPKIDKKATNIKSLYYIEEEIMDENKLEEY